MPTYIDQTGNSIEINDIPKRIVSLVPSQTELLYTLGLDKEIAGITKFCVHPKKWFHTKTRVGGTKNVNLDLIHSIQPDLIIANKEENEKEQVEELKNSYPVWVSDIKTLDDACKMIINVGKLTNTLDKANSLVKKIESGFEDLSFYASSLVNRSFYNSRSTAYFIWRNPYMVAGGDTFIHEMMKLCGFKNIFEKEKRYPIVNIQELRSGNCDLLMLSSEPFPFKSEHKDELQEQLPNTRIILVDGEMFSWYGSRLLYASDYFKSLFHEITQLK